MIANQTWCIYLLQVTTKYNVNNIDFWVVKPWSTASNYQIFYPDNAVKEFLQNFLSLHQQSHTGEASNKTGTHCWKSYYTINIIIIIIINLLQCHINYFDKRREA
jgi:hypothetical protein